MEKQIISCPNCGKKIRIPNINKKIRINCPSCSIDFEYTNTICGISKNIFKLLIFGLCGGVTGFIISEIIKIYFFNQANLNIFRETAIVYGILGLCIGGFIGSAEGVIKKNNFRMKYGIQMGIILGGTGGIISGLIAQFLYGLLSNIDFIKSSFFYHMIIRSLCWCIFGTLLGTSYGIKQNTIGDLKSGALSGAIGGFIGGIIFDPITYYIHINNGLVGRAIGFSIIGLSLGACIQFLQEQSVKHKNKDMYTPLTKKLPSNLRFLE